MKLCILFSFLLLAVLCCSYVDATSVKFGPLCSDINIPRGCDELGCGHYGAPRDDGTRKHLGLDIECADGATVYAPFDVELNGKAAPYGNVNAINDGITLSGEGLCFKMFYINPVSYHGTLKKGQKLGTMLPMQEVYPGITSHVHVQMCDRSDPTIYF